MKEFIEELKHNQSVNLEKGLENRVNIDYVIEKLENMNLIEILEYIKDTYGNDETTNLYIRCLDCDEFIPIYEWCENEDLIECELCNKCYSEEFED